MNRFLHSPKKVLRALFYLTQNLSEGVNSLQSDNLY